jgi:hypothetical protein
MRFEHNNAFDSRFEQIEDLIFFPYVGKDYSLSEDKRILVLARERPISPKSETNGEKEKKEKEKHYFANTLYEYTFISKPWTLSFKNFIKAAVGIKFNYNEDSDTVTISRINEFVSKIAFTNLIDGFVLSKSITNTTLENGQLEKSLSKINQIINVLNPTHIICWGDYVFSNIRRNLDGYKEIANLQDKKKNGFAHIIIENDNKTKIDILRMYHPSYAGFKQLDNEFHKSLSEFLDS